MTAPPAETGPRWRGTAAIVGGAAILCLALALAEHRAALFLLAVPLLVGPLAAWLSAPHGPVPTSHWAWTESGEGRAVGLTGTLDVASSIPSDTVDLRFYPTEPLVPDDAPRVRAVPGEISVTWSLRADRPCLALVPLPAATWRDPTGFVERALPLEGSAARVERFPPEVARLRAVHLRRTTVFPGEVRSRQRGGAGDFFALRPSVPGDTPRQINWRATARQGTLRANDYLRERTGDLLIVLDLRPTPMGPARDAEILALGRAAAYGIASAFLGEKARVGLATYDEYATTVPMGSGRRQAFRIRSTLQAAQVGERAGPAERLAVTLRRYFPPGVGTLVISSLADDDGPLLLAHLRRRGFDPFVLSPSPLPLLRSSGADDPRADEIASRLLHLARRQRLAAAWREAPIIDWEEYWSLAGLSRFLARPIERRTGTA